MKASVTRTERLKLRSRAGSRFASMKSRTSGWSMRRQPIIAPRRAPADWTVRHIASQQSMKDRGPDASAPTPFTAAPLGRMVEKSMPTPPPCCMVSAASFRCWKMPPRLSGTVPITKQLNRVTARPVPAPARIRPAGMKVRVSIASAKRCSHTLRWAGFSLAATAWATRAAVAEKSASPEPSGAQKRYLASQISRAIGTSSGMDTSRSA